MFVQKTRWVSSTISLPTRKKSEEGFQSLRTQVQSTTQERSQKKTQFGANASFEAKLRDASSSARYALQEVDGPDTGRSEHI